MRRPLLQLPPTGVRRSSSATGALTAHTADLAEAELTAIRTLLEQVFDDLEDADYEHALGGVHALVRDGDELVGHGSVVMRRLLHDGGALRTGYVEGVAVHPDHRGRGHGAAVMGARERVVHAAYALWALGATADPRPARHGAAAAGRRPRLRLALRRRRVTGD